MRMNQSRTANSKEVVEEQLRQSDPNYAKKKAEERHKKQLEKEEQAAEEGKDGLGIKEKAGAVPDGKSYLLETVEQVETRDAKKRKGNPDAFGWDVFNQDSLYRAHDKRLKHVQFDEKAYQEQMDKSQDDSAMFGGFGFQATEAGKERLQQAMDGIMAKKKDFSRRRMYVDDEDRTYINERNRIFNKKIQRAFGAYTEEIRQNLERGTAL